MTARGSRPSKPYKGFPLFAHAGGTWAKTIGGRHVHFGPWADPDGALARYEDHMEAVKAGMIPRVRPSGRMPLRDLVNRYLTFQHHRATRHEIGLRSFRDIRSAIDMFADHVGDDTPIGNLSPDNFSGFMEKIGTHGPHYVGRLVTLVRQMFRWGVDQDVIQPGIRFGAGFKKPSATAKRRARVVRLYSPAEIKLLISCARQPARAMILLAINCGLGNTDIAELPEIAIDLDGGILDWQRPKTAIRRRAVLWSETVDALREWLAVRPKPADDNDRGLVFITRFGGRFVREVPQMQDGTIAAVRVVDAVQMVFGECATAAGLWAKGKNKRRGLSDGRNFYTLRRTHRTWTDECRDPHAAALIMGHDTGATVAGLYVQRIEDHRLRSISDHLHAKLFTETESRDRQNAAGCDAAKPRTAARAAGAQGNRKARREKSARSRGAGRG